MYFLSDAQHVPGCKRRASARLGVRRVPFIEPIGASREAFYESKLASGLPWLLSHHHPTRFCNCSASLQTTTMTVFQSECKSNSSLVVVIVRHLHQRRAGGRRGCFDSFSNKSTRIFCCSNSQFLLEAANPANLICESQISSEPSTI